MISDGQVSGTSNNTDARIKILVLFGMITVVNCWGIFLGLCRRKILTRCEWRKNIKKDINLDLLQFLNRAWWPNKQFWTTQTELLHSITSKERGRKRHNWKEQEIAWLVFYYWCRAGEKRERERTKTRTGGRTETFPAPQNKTKIQRRGERKRLHFLLYIL